ncbi:putative cytosol aminopeptidase [Candidatus Desulfarcum epimagneticum]|uniref:Probable cytosol aminopeptidase n=1 Tax=uncultured Desulfobacteraceae bacterium TaxID=218296 RepID=A0A484HPC1_9BACT|nr:putative cytosol aminopeptidase [uncultured Desulfobacteraceae bacterium]
MIEIISLEGEEKNIRTLAAPISQDRDIHEDPIILSLAERAKKMPEFSGKKEEEIILYPGNESPFERALLIGMGKADDISCEDLRAFSGKAVRKCVEMGLDHAALAAPSPEKTGPENARLADIDMAAAMAQGAVLGNHIFDRYKEKKEKKPLGSVFLPASPQNAGAMKKAVQRAEIVCKGTLLAREWVSMPSNDKKPAELAKIMARAARGKNIKVTELTGTGLAERGMNALLAVAKGSRSGPRMLVMEYRHEKARRHVALIGKGVTFDSGGVNLKPTGSLEDMKTDMSGAAAAAAAVISLAELDAPVHATAVLPLVENMPSGQATRPGDIVKSFSGKTVEILNTDAEGRLILIDAMSWAEKEYAPDVIIDIATLTGACVVALGEKIAGVFSHDDALADAIVEAGEKNHEPCWRMPLPGFYKDLLKSDLADIQNISSSKWGGAITAALFLNAFVKKARWAHIDIAGPASAKKGHPYCGAGGTGFGVRLLCDVAEGKWE